MYVQETRRWVKHIDFIALDIICLMLSFFAAYEWRNDFAFKGLTDEYKYFLVIILFAHVAIIFLTENYGRVLKRGYYREFLATAKQMLLMLAVTAVLLFASKNGANFSRIIIFLTYVIYLLISYCTRIVWKIIVRRKVKTDKQNRKLIVITDNERFNEAGYYDLISSIDARTIGGIIIIDSNIKGERLGDIEVVADGTDMYEYLIRNWVDEVFVDINPLSDRYCEMFGKLNETGITIHTRIGNYAPDVSRISALEQIGNFKVLTTSIRVISPSQQLIKRLFDILGSIVGLVITFVVGIFVVPAIKIADKGPAIYASERVGANGRKFRFYKFRSMYMDADERKKELANQNTIKDGMMFKIDNDPRIIKGIGNFIRKTSIDELPQFWNVLKGDMSLVGTRPPTLDEWEKYGKHHRSRMSVKPGITGMWQVSGRSEIKDFEEVVKLDNEYINNWDYGLDIKILIMTVFRVLKSDGAK